MDKLARLTGRGDEIVPAARRLHQRRQREDPIRKRIAAVVIEEQPTIQFLLEQRFLDLFDEHLSRLYDCVAAQRRSTIASSLDVGARVKRLTTMRLAREKNKAG
jgi:hypothetical protein